MFTRGRKIKDRLKSGRRKRVRGAVTWRRHFLVRTTLLMALRRLSTGCPHCVIENSSQQASEGLDNLMTNDFVDLEWKYCTPNLFRRGSEVRKNLPSTHNGAFSATMWEIHAFLCYTSCSNLYVGCFLSFAFSQSRLMIRGRDDFPGQRGRRHLCKRQRTCHCGSFGCLPLFYWMTLKKSLLSFFSLLGIKIGDFRWGLVLKKLFSLRKKGPLLCMFEIDMMKFRKNLFDSWLCFFWVICLEICVHLNCLKVFMTDFSLS